jgi:plastocyanin
MYRLSEIVTRVIRSSSPVVLNLATVATLAACGGSGMTASTTSSNPPPPDATVNATPQIAFSPAQLTVAQGGTVTFAFGSVGHNVYFDNDPDGAPAEIPGVNSNTNVDRVFGTAGVYNFNCHIHPGMHGTITVAASNTGYP